MGRKTFISTIYKTYYRGPCKFFSNDMYKSIQLYKLCYFRLFVQINAILIKIDVHCDVIALFIENRLTRLSFLTKTKNWLYHFISIILWRIGAKYNIVLCISNRLVLHNTTNSEFLLVKMQNIAPTEISYEYIIVTAWLCTIS